MKDTKVTLHEEASRREWTLPDAAVEPPDSTGARPMARPVEPAPARPGRNDFRCGDKVTFEDRYLATRIGEVVRINQRTATIDTGDGHTWRVPFSMLRHVLDI